MYIFDRISLIIHEVIIFLLKKIPILELEYNFVVLTVLNNKLLMIVNFEENNEAFVDLCSKRLIINVIFCFIIDKIR